MSATIAAEAPTPHEIVEWVTACTTEVFQTMLGMEAQSGEHFVEDPGKGLTMGVIGIIGLVGEWTGTAVVSCSSPLACKIATNMLMEEYPSVTDEVLDAIAEMTNMIIGSLKNLLEGKLGRMGLSIPAVVFGRNFATRRVTAPPGLSCRVPRQSCGAFSVQPPGPEHQDERHEHRGDDSRQRRREED